jgi:hypothetical protein
LKDISARPEPVLAIHAAVEPRQLTAGTKFVAAPFVAARSSSGNAGAGRFGFGGGAVVVVFAGVAVPEERTTTTVGGGVEPLPPQPASASVAKPAGTASKRQRIRAKLGATARGWVNAW